MGVEEWDPTKESPAKLRKRLERQVAKHIDAQLQGATSLSTKTPRVNRKAVDWMILRRACRWSDNQINNWYSPGKDNRKEISKQIPEAEAALEIR
jgi:vancomycin resistance protein YoaR